MAVVGVSSQGVAPFKTSVHPLWFSASFRRRSSAAARSYVTCTGGSERLESCSLQNPDKPPDVATFPPFKFGSHSATLNKPIFLDLEPHFQRLRCPSAHVSPSYEKHSGSRKFLRPDLRSLQNVHQENISKRYLDEQLPTRDVIPRFNTSKSRSATGTANIEVNYACGPSGWQEETKRLKAVKLKQHVRCFPVKAAKPEILEDERTLTDATQDRNCNEERNLSRASQSLFSGVYVDNNKWDSLPGSGSDGRGGSVYITPIESAASDATSPINASVETHIQKRDPPKRSEVHSSDPRENLVSIYDKVFIVDTVSAARRVVNKLKQYKHLIHACDTEVAKIDVKDETPVDHGEVICFSIYSGPDADFDGKSCIWVDVLDGGRDVLMEFASFFEDPSIRKVWHNYSFDCHVLENYGIKVSGFHADTLHLARLWDSSRRANGGYSLEALTGNLKVMSDRQKKDDDGLILGKISMKSIFGKKKVKKDGSEGKLIAIAPVEELQREERVPWICYSAFDSISTLKLYESLKVKLKDMNWVLDGVALGSMYDFYEKYWRPFGELLVKMETEGMLVDRAHLAEIEKVATVEQKIAAEKFRKWASKYCPHAIYMNVGSDTQLRQLFFGGTANRKDPNESVPEIKNFKVPNIDKVIEEGKKVPLKYRTISLCKIGNEIQTEMFTPTGWPSLSGDALKAMAGKISADLCIVDGTDETDEIPSEIVLDKNRETGNNMTRSDDVDTSAYGSAYRAFGEGEGGREACHAIAALCEVCSIDSLISNFILPLQGSHISGKQGRIHCSLNINTETGRLSARRPNLQNQPALEKDRYKIRKAFVAAPGNSLIVADYGQLELRILAHLANCKSMLEAFKAGGDFHSRTAMNMYPHIREAVEKKRVLLEWYPQPGEEKPPVPLLKDAFASERRKAKMLNFSIAYGKTPVGLSRDWKVSVKEAKKTVDLWYRERQEVLRWQEERKKEAEAKQCVHTLLGRARRFPSMTHASNPQKGHIERAAINTPVQGSAADVAMCAMLEISKNARLKELGWRLLLQVHDEVILEGPSESAEIAKAIVVECMSKPFNGTNFLKVDLAVDAKCAQNWYAAK
ncbi:DNA polymerase I A, chloroplastic/mitochondrial-like [Aristolochia californica]|uniref:DNA polymerase I A, chloroplastic/mitochondrial-like n=1 Tax=Aristolochia californica TaxID=171875 RepID=UPI0035E000BF